MRVQVIMTGRRRHFYLHDLGASSVARISHIAGISDSSLETFAVSPAGQVSRAEHRSMPCRGRLHCCSPDW